MGASGEAVRATSFLRGSAGVAGGTEAPALFSTRPVSARLETP